MAKSTIPPVEIPDGYKRCSNGKYCLHSSGPVLPASIDYFHVHGPSPDGLKPKCKACRCEEERRKRQSLPPFIPRPALGNKRCNWCMDEMPATQEYFHKKSDSPDDLAARCIRCTHVFQRQWRLDRIDVVRERKRLYSISHREHIKEKNRIYNQTHRAELRRKKLKYIAENKEAFYARKRRYITSPRGVAMRRAAEHRRRARERQAEGTFSKEDVLNIYKSQRGLCWWCGKSVGDNYHLDHRIPLDKNGTNWPENIVISCPQCNQSKINKMPWEWNGRLL